MDVGRRSINWTYVKRAILHRLIDCGVPNDDTSMETSLRA